MSPLRDEVFERLYSEHAQPLYAFLSYRTGDRVLAEDLLADTFERALRARWRFDRRKASEKTWLYSIALNLLRDHYRRGSSEAKALQRVAVAGRAGPGGGGEHNARPGAAAPGAEGASGGASPGGAPGVGAPPTGPERPQVTGE